VDPGFRGAGHLVVPDAARAKETSVRLIVMHGVDVLTRVIAESNADIGDWLCRVLGICG
jgi:hypothetical protein